jgi:hypothetical protein
MKRKILFVTTMFISVVVLYGTMYKYENNVGIQKIYLSAYNSIKTNI